MHVLYFHQHFSIPNGAPGTRPYELSQMLIKRGHEVTLVCEAVFNKRGSIKLNGASGNGYRRGEVDGIDLIELDYPYSDNQNIIKRTYSFMKFALKSTELVLKEPYDLLFASSTPISMGIPGIIMKRFKEKPFVLEVRDLWPELPRELGIVTNPLVLKAMNGLEWVSYHSADRCIGLSPGMVQGISRRGINEKRIATVPNGCDIDFFKPGEESRTRIPGVKEDDRVAVYIGNHGKVNGLDAVLDAAVDLLERERSDIKLVFIGDGDKKQDLVARKKREGLDNCLFLEPVPLAELASLLNAADVGLMVLDNISAFYYGTSPNKFFDYIASGLPVLNNYPGWLADLIEENDCGKEVPPEDPEAFARGLIEMFDDPEGLKRRGKCARKLAEERFNRRLLGEKFVNFLEEAADA